MVVTLHWVTVKRVRGAQNQQRQFFPQINILFGMEKLHWTKEGRESINGARSDKAKLVSLLIMASGQLMSPPSVVQGLLGSRALTKKKPKTNLRKATSMPRMRLQTEIGADRLGGHSMLNLPRG